MRLTDFQNKQKIERKKKKICCSRFLFLFELFIFEVKFYKLFYNYLLNNNSHFY